MARPLRFLTPDAALVEVTLRTVHGRLLLRPSRAANDLLAGVIGRAQRKYGMRIHGFAVLSNHAHFLLSPESSQHLAGFMSYVAGNVASSAVHEWREKFWARHIVRFSSPEEEAQVSWLTYLLGQG